MSEFTLCAQCNLPRVAHMDTAIDHRFIEPPFIQGWSVLVMCDQHFDPSPENSYDVTESGHKVCSKCGVLLAWAMLVGDVRPAESPHPGMTREEWAAGFTRNGPSLR